MTSTDNGVVLSINYLDRQTKVWVFRPDDADIFINQVKGFAEILDTVPANKATLNQVACAVGWLLPLDLLEHCNNIKWIQSTSSGLDHLSKYHSKNPDILLTSMSGLNADIVAEYALSHILAARWRILQYHHQAQQKIWQGYKTTEASETNVLIIGLGNIGKKIAKNVKFIGMRVLAVRRNASSFEGVDKVYSFADLHKALGLANYIVLSLPLTPETRDLIGKSEFSAMKQNSYLINLSRGGIVNEKELANALNYGQIKGAVLDVTETEPYPMDGSLWGVKNLLITPHIAGEHKSFAKRAALYWAQNLKLFLTNSLGSTHESPRKN